MSGFREVSVGDLQVLRAKSGKRAGWEKGEFQVGSMVEAVGWRSHCGTSEFAVGEGSRGYPGVL